MMMSPQHRGSSEFITERCKDKIRIVEALPGDKPECDEHLEVSIKVEVVCEVKLKMLSSGHSKLLLQSKLDAVLAELGLC